MVRLTPWAEMREKLPTYMEAFESRRVSWREEVCEIPDFHVPADPQNFERAITEAAEALRAGKNVLIHCGAGRGRTGLFAICLLTALGVPATEAQEAVGAAGSASETEAQREFVRRWTGS